MKSLLLIVLFVSLCELAQAQIVVQKNTSDMKTSIELGQKLTKEAIVEKMGTPLKYQEQYDDVCYMANYRIYKYPGLTFSTVDNVVHVFGVYTGEYVVKINNKYIAKVGMPIQTFRNSIPASEVRIETRDKNIIFRFKIAGTDDLSDDALFVVPDSQGIIRDIFWHVPV